MRNGSYGQCLNCPQVCRNPSLSLNIIQLYCAFILLNIGFAIGRTGSSSLYSESLQQLGKKSGFMLVYSYSFSYFCSFFAFCCCLFILFLFFLQTIGIIGFNWFDSSYCLTFVFNVYLRSQFSYNILFNDFFMFSLYFFRFCFSFLYKKFRLELANFFFKFYYLFFLFIFNCTELLCHNFTLLLLGFKSLDSN